MGGGVPFSIGKGTSAVRRTLCVKDGAGVILGEIQGGEDLGWVIFIAERGSVLPPILGTVGFLLLRSVVGVKVRSAIFAVVGFLMLELSVFPFGSAKSMISVDPCREGSRFTVDILGGDISTLRSVDLSKPMADGSVYVPFGTVRRLIGEDPLLEIFVRMDPAIDPISLSLRIFLSFSTPIPAPPLL